MKIVQAHTGATCVPVPSRGVIFVDPNIGHHTAVNVIQAILPEAHPDAVEHWVEAVIPTAMPLPEVVKQYRPAPVAVIKPGKHRYAKPRRVNYVGTARRIAVAAAIAAVSATAGPALTGQGVTPVAASQHWTNPVFSTVQNGAGWHCVGIEDKSLSATCIARDGTPMKVEAWVGPDTVTFTFNYEGNHNEMKVFATREGLESWLSSNGGEDNYPNLVVGERWVIYGTDPDRLERWASELGQDVALPPEMEHAALAMGMIEGPGKDGVAGSQKSPKLPPVVRELIERIVAGDPALAPAEPVIIPAPVKPAVGIAKVPVIDAAPVVESPEPEVTEPAVGTAPVTYPAETAPDPLTDPIVVPEDTATPVAEETEQAIEEPAPPVFGETVSELAKEKEKGERPFGQQVKELKPAA